MTLIAALNSVAWAFELPASHDDLFTNGCAAGKAIAYISLTEYMEDSIFSQMHISPDTVFSALAHTTRLRCLILLVEKNELCVCELTHAIGAAQPNISRHLAHLREAGLVSDRREGLWIHYRINPGLPKWVKGVLKQTARGVLDTAPFVDDLAALESMANRPGAPRCA